MSTMITITATNIPIMLLVPTVSTPFLAYPLNIQPPHHHDLVREGSAWRAVGPLDTNELRAKLANLQKTREVAQRELSAYRNLLE